MGARVQQRRKQEEKRRLEEKERQWKAWEANHPMAPFKWHYEIPAPPASPGDLDATAKTLLLERYEKERKRPRMEFSTLLRAAEREFADMTQTTAQLRATLEDMMLYAKDGDRQSVYMWVTQRFREWDRAKHEQTM